MSLEIKHCNKCPYFNSEQVYTSDSFENVHDWVCVKQGKKIAQLDAMNRIPEIPKWCYWRTLNSGYECNNLDTAINYFDEEKIKAEDRGELGRFSDYRAVVAWLRELKAYRQIKSHIEGIESNDF